MIQLYIDSYKEKVMNELVSYSYVDEFIEKVPKRLRGHITSNLRNEITKVLDSDIGDAYREGMLVNTDLMEKYSTNPDRYERAVKFVTYLNLGKKTYEAFALSHPEKYREYKAQAEADGWDNARLRNKLSLKGANFKNTQIVTELLVRAIVPLGVAFHHHKAKAVEKLVDLIENADSQRVQMESADKLLTHLCIDKTEYKMSAETDTSNQNVISTLAGVLDKMVSLHQSEKEINPSKSNSVIMDAIVTSATKRDSE